MGTTTARLGLYKPLDNGSELVNVQQDLNGNTDKLDLAPGFQVVTSSTRPSSPFSGKAIAESDTSYRTYFSNGTSPASASWVEIPNSSGTYGGNLAMASGKTLSIAGAGHLTLGASGQLNIGGSTSDASIAIVNPNTTYDLLSGRVTGDTQSRIVIDTDGAINWGPGASAAVDTRLYRSAASTLRTDDSLIVDTDLTVSGVINSATNLNMGAWSSWTPTWTTSTGSATPSFGNATVDCKYTRVGRTIFFRMDITFGSTTNFGAGATTGDNWRMTLPPIAAASSTAATGWASYFNGATSNAVMGIAVLVNTTTMQFYTGTGSVGNTTINGGIVDSLSPSTWASGNAMSVIGHYEAAS